MPSGSGAHIPLLIKRRNTEVEDKFVGRICWEGDELPQRFEYVRLVAPGFRSAEASLLAELAGRQSCSIVNSRRSKSIFYWIEGRSPCESLGSATRTLRLFSAQIRAIIAMLEIAARISAAPAGNLG